LHREVVWTRDRAIIVAAVDAERQLAWAVFAFSERARVCLQLDRPHGADADGGMHIQWGGRVSKTELPGGDAGQVGQVVSDP